jgi:3-phenylpropionate/trans-cinnamate dioxygenase ferredoxin reductase subunit
VAGATLAGRADEWAQAPGFWSTIGRRTLKQAAWGDGWDETRLDGDGDGFTAWYGRDGRVVGVLTHERDDDYERGRDLVESGAPWPPPGL